MNSNSYPKSIFGSSSATRSSHIHSPADKPWTSNAPLSDQRPVLQRRSISLPKAFASPSPVEEPSSVPKATDTRKRLIVQLSHPLKSPSSLPPPLHKRRRLYGHYRHTLENFDFPHAPNPSSPNQPPSPLFFSNNTKRERPRLPARFSSSEAGARMLSKTHGEDSGIKTVTLARGVLTESSPPAAAQTPVPRISLDRVPQVRQDTPLELEDNSASAQVLNEIGIVELLEQDGRPTFIVDLGDPKNFGPGPFRIAYTNPALRANSTWLDLVTGKAIDPGGPLQPNSTSPTFQSKRLYQQFKNWLLSAATQGESLDVCLPSFFFGGIAWSCSTIRKRLRVVSASSVLSSSPSQHSPLSSALSPPKTSSTETARNDLPTREEPEPADYFGSAAPPAPSISAPSLLSQDASNTTELVRQRSRTIEHTVQPPDPSKIPQMGYNGRTFNQAKDIVEALDKHPSLTAELVLSATTAAQIDPFSHSLSSREHSPQTHSGVSPAESASQGFFDWTRLPVSEDLPSHIRFARSVDWSLTALGPIENWPPDLRQMCNLIMASPHPAAMYWGNDLVAIYNEAYVLLAGQKHPQLMGQSYRDAWVEIWDEVKDVFASARQTGEATMKDDDCLFIKRSDYLEETYFSWSIIPMVGGDGSVTGLYNPAFEKTRRKIAERRMLTLREVGERTATARDVKGFWDQVLSALRVNEHDTPFVLLYSVSDESDSDSSSIHSSSLSGAKQCSLEGALGVPFDHPAAPAQLDLKEGKDGFGPIFREAMKLDKPVLLDVQSDVKEGLVDARPASPVYVSESSGPHHAGIDSIPPSMLQGIAFRGFGDPCRAVVVCPIHPTTGDTILGFLVLGVNPRRPYDDDYHLFVQLLSRQLATSLASVVLFEEEIRRGQKAAKLAALDRIELSEQLAARTQEARDMETRFTRMAEFSPTGLFIANGEGHITYCNDTWYEITRLPKHTQNTDRWIDTVQDEDQDMVRHFWDNLIKNVSPVTFEFRFKAPWEDKNGNRGDTWVLFSAYPEKYTEDVIDPDVDGVKAYSAREGSLKSVFGSITNISQQKWAEGFQKRKMEEAVELKRQQENFIDITSHEMRNPLSAILQCADEISTTLVEFRNESSKAKKKEYQSLKLDPVLDSSIDAAQTIALCAQHQKRIVDDVLTMSKLDSAMLMVTPVDVRPVEVVQRALKMFEGEVATALIEMNFVVDKSFSDLGIDWVRVDPSRVLQVLINLTTNAIKFTSTESKKRTIRVTIAASLTRPSELPDSERQVDYFPSRSKHLDMTEGADWGTGEEVYVQFTVRDTGRGLSDEEKKMLFLRFSQASPRTHVQYGGSGLGLFISRELTELQGGEIGVSSEKGRGSTFAFYVRARRTSRPDSEDAKISTPPRMPTSEMDALKVGHDTRTASVKTRDFAAEPSAPRHKRKDGEIKVLIVEDNLVNQRVLQKQLRNAGFDVSVANHGGEALERLRETVYWHTNDGFKARMRNDSHTEEVKELHVVLMDQEMPVMNGVTATKRIREWEESGEILRHVPIIAVTANARQEQIEALLAAGMDDVVSKPFRIPELTPKIEELAAKYPGDAPPSK